LFFNQKLRSKIGMDGLFLPIDYNNVMFSSARSMARYGLLVQNGGWWANTPVLNDPAYFQQMVNTSQDLNLSYGYLWWLNGKASYMVPGLQFMFPGQPCPDAPADMYAAMGKNGQFIDVVPSMGLVLVRMGNAPDGSEVPYVLNNQIWQRLNEVMCDPSDVDEAGNSLIVNLLPNPATCTVAVEAPAGAVVVLYDWSGKQVAEPSEVEELSVAHLPKGTYFVRVFAEGKLAARKLVVQ
jgi:hypothetical protein